MVKLYYKDSRYIQSSTEKFYTIRKGNQGTMESDNRNEFRLRDYVQVFEKTLNYMAGVMIAAMVAGICHIVSNPNWHLTIETMFRMIQNLHKNPKEFFCLITSVLSTLPYYFYYCLKDNTGWNACNGQRDNKALRKIYVLYEFGIICLLYLLMKDDMSFSASKLFLSIINVLLTFLYLFFVILDRRKEERIGYFLSILALAIFIFVGLGLNNYKNIENNMSGQNYSIILLVVLFIINSALNLGFLVKSDSSDEAGIISNRKKIMIPIVTMSIYTVTIIYCFYYSGGEWRVMVTAAVYVMVYEICISLLKCKREIVKMFWCSIFFVLFVFLMPVMIWLSNKIPNELAMNWLILVGVSIHMAAIKYWGYIIKFLFSQKERKQLTVKTMNMMIWFRNSILGGMVFVTSVLWVGKKYYIMLFVILACSVASEIFISYTFDRRIKHTDVVYLLGRFLEFIFIIAPIGAFILMNIMELPTIPNGGAFTKLPVKVIITIDGIIFLANITYVVYQWEKGGIKRDKNNRNEGMELSIKGIFLAVEKNTQRLFSHVKDAMPNRSAKNLCGIVGISCAYMAVQFLVEIIFFPDLETGILGFALIKGIFIVDWCILSKWLTDYYIKKVKLGRHVMEFNVFFEESWKECMDTLDEFKESRATQFSLGSRIRPILFFMGSSYGRYDSLVEEDYRQIAKAACSLELIHKASIVLDDYLDGDTMRNGKQSVYEQYNKEINPLFLFVNAMLAKAQINFMECKDDFRCNESIMLENSRRLSEIIFNLSRGGYKELDRGEYENQSEEEIKSIIFMETVSLIQGSIELGYRSFHVGYGDKDYERLVRLGEAFGYIFQYLNDLEPFSQRKLYEDSKGTIEHFDHGKKNIAILCLYGKVTNEGKEIIKEGKYERILQLYQDYNVEKDVIDMVKIKMEHIKEDLSELKRGDEKWAGAFTELFNMALEKKGWGKKIPLL